MTQSIDVFPMMLTAAPSGSSAAERRPAAMCSMRGWAFAALWWR
ncbi:MAG TPA: hypothetical protein PLR99_03500 [Polyangiaceae bacterium]|nr:hypothetical protein [Polyangiaceae bacterium]